MTVYFGDNVAGWQYFLVTKILGDSIFGWHIHLVTIFLVTFTHGATERKRHINCDMLYSPWKTKLDYCLWKICKNDLRSSQPSQKLLGQWWIGTIPQDFNITHNKIIPNLKNKIYHNCQRETCLLLVSLCSRNVFHSSVNLNLSQCPCALWIRSPNIWPCDPLDRAEWTLGSPLC